MHWLEQLSEIFARPEARAVLAGAGLVILCVIGFYVVGKIRDNLREADAGPSEFMSNFRELHARGELSDEEYRTIKAKLASRMKEHLAAQLKAKEEASDEEDGTAEDTVKG